MSDRVAIALITVGAPLLATMVGNILLTWKAVAQAKSAATLAEAAVHQAQNAATHAKFAAETAAISNQTAVTLGATQNAAIAQVHDAVNGGMAASKKEIFELKAEVVRLNEVIEQDSKLRAIRKQGS